VKARVAARCWNPRGPPRRDTTMSTPQKCLADSGWKLVGQGRNRVVYARGRVVVKVPRPNDNGVGLADNHREAYTFKVCGTGPTKDGVCYARCRLLKNGWLMMEKVEPLTEPAPSWADWIDCQQVGKTHTGRVVAYDFGY
jgi:hypothetical protein